MHFGRSGGNNSAKIPSGGSAAVRLFARLAALRDDTRAWWEDQLTWEADDYDEDQRPYRADAESPRRFLEGQALPWYENRQRELEIRPVIRAQAFGEAIDPHRLERLARYEVHLDRKRECMLAMLLRLQQLRRETKTS